MVFCGAEKILPEAKKREVRGFCLTVGAFWYKSLKRCPPSGGFIPDQLFPLLVWYHGLKRCPPSGGFIR